MFVTPAYAQTAATGAGASLLQFMPVILIFLIMYFLMIRPQQKRLKEHRDMVAALTRGDEVVTSGGIVGRVSAVHDDRLEVEIAPGVKVRVIRSSVTAVLNKPAPAAK